MSKTQNDNLSLFLNGKCFPFIKSFKKYTGIALCNLDNSLDQECSVYIKRSNFSTYECMTRHKSDLTGAGNNRYFIRIVYGQ